MSFEDMYKYYIENVKPIVYDILLVGPKDAIDLNRIKEDTGYELVELTSEQIFGY